MFDQSAITSLGVNRDPGGGFRVQWTTYAPIGTPFQVYVGGKLQRSTVAHFAVVPAWSGTKKVVVGTVAPGEEQVDFSWASPGGLPDRAALEWYGGTYLDASGNDDVWAFNIYGEHTPGAGIDYTQILATIASYSEGLIADGYGLGDFGSGGWGKVASRYSYTSRVLSSGTWAFAVKPRDAAGNEGAAITWSIAIVLPPGPPAFYADGTRIHYAWNETGHIITLTWNASPG